MANPIHYGGAHHASDDDDFEIVFENTAPAEIVEDSQAIIEDSQAIIEESNYATASPEVVEYTEADVEVVEYTEADVVEGSQSVIVNLDIPDSKTVDNPDDASASNQSFTQHLKGILRQEGILKQKKPRTPPMDENDGCGCSYEGNLGRSRGRESLDRRMFENIMKTYTTPTRRSPPTSPSSIKTMSDFDRSVRDSQLKEFHDFGTQRMVLQCRILLVEMEQDLCWKMLNETDPRHSNRDNILNRQRELQIGENALDQQQQAIYNQMRGVITKDQLFHSFIESRKSAERYLTASMASHSVYNCKGARFNWILHPSPWGDEWERPVSNGTYLRSNEE